MARKEPAMTNNNFPKISYEEYCEARNEMQKELREFADQLFPQKGSRYVEIYTDFWFGKGIESQVNWSAIGSVSAEEAIKFAQLLTKAAELAKNFKYNGYKVDED